MSPEVFKVPKVPIDFDIDIAAMLGRLKCQAFLKNRKIKVNINLDVLNLDKVLQSFASAGMPKSSQCLGLNLPNPFPCNVEVLTHLFQGMSALLADTETYA